MPRIRILSLVGAAMALSLALAPTSADARSALPVAGGDNPGISGVAVTTKVWAACGRTTSENKIVRTYERYRGDAGQGHLLRGGKSNLLCGTVDFGYRHILRRHLDEWEQTTVLTQNNWRDVADFAIAAVLSDPDKVTYSPGRKTFCYSRVVYLANKRTGRVVDTRTPHVVVSETNRRIITAIPSKSQCK